MLVQRTAPVRLATQIATNEIPPGPPVSDNPELEYLLTERKKQLGWLLTALAAGLILLFAIWLKNYPIPPKRHLPNNRCPK